MTTPGALPTSVAMLTVLVFSLLILTFTAISAVSPEFGTASVFNPGPHGLSEMLYAYSSAAGNNGSAFAGLSSNSDWYNVTLGITMLGGRFFVILPMLAIAGALHFLFLRGPVAAWFADVSILF